MIATVVPARRLNRRSAFTLLEILIVVAILVVLAGVSGVFVFRYLDEARRDRAKVDVRTIAKAADSYAIALGNRPTSLQELVQPPDGRSPYMEASSLKDPWGNDYQYDASGSNNGGLHADVWTTTPEGQKIGNWDSTTQHQ